MNAPDDARPDIEDRLAAHLRAQAATAAGIDDWGDLTARLHRSQRRRVRALGAVAIIFVLAAGAVGFGVGRHGTAGAIDVSALGPSSSPTTSVGATHIPVVPRPGAPAPSFGQTAGGPVSSPGLEQGGVQGVITGAYPGPGGPLGRLFVRTAAGGVTVRAYRADYPPYDDGNPFWTAPDWCFANGYFQAEISTAEVAGVVGSDSYASVRAGSMSGSIGVVGSSEGAPMLVVIAELPAGADAARVTFPGGASDSMDAVNGIVMLAGSVPASAVDKPSATVEALAHGAVVATQKFDYSMASPSSDPACQVPAVTLPPPGDQPADAAAARAAIEHDFEVVYGGPADEASAAVDDPAGVLPPLRQELASGQFADAVKSAHATVADLVFDRPDHAWVEYTIVTSLGNFSQRFGEASLVDGQWKIALSTVCNDISLAGVHCPSS